MYLERQHRDGHKAYEKMLSITVREMPIKLQQGISSPPQNDHPPKDLQRLNCCLGQGEQGILLHGGRGCKWVGTPTKGDTTEIPSNSII